jgi:hypothetical protein
MPLGRSLSYPVAILLLFAGCTSAGNTLQQDRVWDAYAACKTPGRVPTNVQIERVNPDGTWYSRTQDGSYGVQELNACMRAEIAKWRASTTPTTQRAVVVAPQQPTNALSAPPTWQPGDEWAYRYESPTGTGTYVWSVDREEAIDGAPHYVIKTGTREIFYRKSDFAYTREAVDGAIVLKNTPSRFQLMWPLHVGKTWEQSTREERPVARQTIERVDFVTVESEEMVTVPAGTFKALKVVYRNKRTGAVRYEAWYALEVKQVVKLRENLESGPRVRELIAFKLR